MRTSHICIRDAFFHELKIFEILKNFNIFFMSVQMIYIICISHRSRQVLLTTNIEIDENAMFYLFSLHSRFKRERGKITHWRHIIRHFLPTLYKRLFRKLPRGRADGNSRQRSKRSSSVLPHPSTYAGQNSSLLPLDPLRRIWNLQWHKPSIYDQQQLLPV